MTLSDIEKRHQGWHAWGPIAGMFYAVRVNRADGTGGGTTLYADSLEHLDKAICQFRNECDQAVQWPNFGIAGAA